MPATGGIDGAPAATALLKPRNPRAIPQIIHPPPANDLFIESPGWRLQEARRCARDWLRERAKSSVEVLSRWRRTPSASLRKRNGVAANDTVTRLDGASVTNQYFGSLPDYSPGIEALESVKVLTSSFDGGASSFGKASRRMRAC